MIAAVRWPRTRRVLLSADPGAVPAARALQREVHAGPAPAVLLVACGGAAGGVLREAVRVLLPPDPGTWGWAVLVVNAVGGFALAALLSVLARRPSERVRLLVGTGLIGGLTTFSGLVLEAVLLAEASTLSAAAYVVVAVSTLLGAAWLGARAGAGG